MGMFYSQQNGQTDKLVKVLLNGRISLPGHSRWSCSVIAAYFCVLLACHAEQYIKSNFLKIPKSLHYK
jgi:hypothetical protein